MGITLSIADLQLRVHVLSLQNHKTPSTLPTRTSIHVRNAWQ